MIVLVVREKKPTVVPSSSLLATGGNDDLQRLSDSKEVQGRLRKDISGLVENPSPFEEEDAPLRNQLKAQTNVPAPVRKGVLAAAPGPAAGSRASRAQPQEFALQDLVHASNAKAAASPPLQWKGTFSAIAGFRTVVIRSSVEWQGLWREHTAYIVPPPPAPEVDFGDSMVLGIFDGTKPAAGFAIEIEDIQTKPDKIVVAYRETGPPAGVSAAAVITQPYHLRVIPKTGLPVIFEKLP
jgi:hypothetical protein